MPRAPIPTWTFVLVVVRKGDQFLLVREPARHGGGYYLPAGRVEPGETLFEAALRETKEEAGISIVLHGLIRVEHAPHPAGTTRMRVLFTGSPVGEQPLKTVADHESQGAVWATLPEIAAMRMRGSDALEAIHFVARGGRILPLDAISGEGGPFPI